MPAPERLEPPPWKIGQWAIYAGTRSYERIAIVAEDSCGTWFRHTYTSYDHAIKTWLCVQPLSTTLGARETPIDRLQMVIVQEGSTREVLDMRGSGHWEQKRAYRSLIALLFGCTCEDAKREDVDVPAGHFTDAIRTERRDRSGVWTLWSHPAVPFAGLVLSEGPSGPLRLVGFGYDRHGTALPELAEPPPSPPRSSTFIEFGVGFGWLGRGAGEASTGGYGLTFRGGKHLRWNLDLVLEANAIFDESYSPDPTVVQSQRLAVAGVRWFPLNPRALGGFANMVFIRADLGWAYLGRYAPPPSNPASINGFAMGGAIGLMPFHRRGYSMVIEVSDRAVFFTSGEGVRQTMFVTMSALVPWPD